MDWTVRTASWCYTARLTGPVALASSRTIGILGLARGWEVIESEVSARRIGLCWEATRAPRWTRIPQAWAVSAAQAGLLRARQQSEKSIVKQTEKQTGIVSYASTAKGTFTLNQNIFEVEQLEDTFAGGTRNGPKKPRQLLRKERLVTGNPFFFLTAHANG